MTNFIIFPHQLFEDISILKKYEKIYLIEHPVFFGYREKKLIFNKKKLILHLASMMNYCDYLSKSLKKSINYIKITSIPEKNRRAFDFIKEIDGDIAFYNPVDHFLFRQIETYCQKNKREFEVIETPNFITSDAELRKYYTSVKTKKKPFFQTSFYKWQRDRLHILSGSKLSYDAENRKPIPKGTEIPVVVFPKETDYIKRAVAIVDKEFLHNYGTCQGFWCPITFVDAKKWLDIFINERLKSFGTYEDAIVEPDSKYKNAFLFHSGISSSLNIGLLDPKYVVQRILEKGKGVAINNIEGFIRQVIGWREFSRYTYIHIYKEMTTTNYFKAENRLNQRFYDGTVGLSIMDATIKKAFDTGYLHHIERLMIMGSLMNLMGIHPDDVYAWFMEFAVDSYDWVMINNVYSMALYSDGGLTTTKAYISSSNYEMVRKSDYKKGEWCDIWDSLYWSFIEKHAPKMKKMGRFGGIQVSFFERKKPDVIKRIKQTYKKFMADVFHL
jgi:deoxyribodipyrimidine photolyase-related protein